MLKKIVLAVMPLTLLASVNADDLDIDIASITDADIEIVENDLNVDVDALSADAGQESEEEAIEACFRRFRYSCRSWGRHHYYRSCYNHCYNYCRPLYSYRTISYCPPVCRTVLTPVYSYYWGCY